MGDSSDDFHSSQDDPGRQADADKGVAPIMSIRRFVPLVLVAGAGAVAIAVAPLAEAAPSCTSTGLASVCQSAGNAQISATPPPVDYGPAYPFLGNVLIFHHDGRR